MYKCICKLISICSNSPKSVVLHNQYFLFWISFIILHFWISLTEIKPLLITGYFYTGLLLALILALLPPQLSCSGPLNRVAQSSMTSQPVYHFLFTITKCSQLHDSGIKMLWDTRYSADTRWIYYRQRLRVTAHSSQISLFTAAGAGC